MNENKYFNYSENCELYKIYSYDELYTLKPNNSKIHGIINNLQSYTIQFIENKLATGHTIFLPYDSLNKEITENICFEFKNMSGIGINKTVVNIKLLDKKSFGNGITEILLLEILDITDNKIFYGIMNIGLFSSVLIESHTMLANMEQVYKKHINELKEGYK